MMNMRWIATLLACTCTTAVAQAVSIPVAGAVRDFSGAIQAVNGIAGNFLFADTRIGNAVSSAFSGAAGLVKTDSELLVLDSSNHIVSRLEASAGPALFAFDANGIPALAFYSSTLFRFANGTPRPVAWTGNPVAIASAGLNSALILDKRDEQIWRVRVSLTSGVVEYEALLGSVHPPATLLHGGTILYFDGTDAIVQAPSGVERRLPTGIVPAYFEQIADHWVAIREAGPGRLFALRIRQERLDFYQLPEVSQ